jgi:hypothetical protein
LVENAWKAQKREEIMDAQPNIDAEGRTFRQLLEFLDTFGYRYRLRQGQNKAALTPRDLLTRLTRLEENQDSLLERRCEVRDEEAMLAGVAFSVWHVYFISYKGRQQQPVRSSPYLIEDLLESDSVLNWLEQQEPDRVIAVLQREARMSTFLEHYFQAVTGFVPKDLAATRLPIWCTYLEDLIFGLNPTGRLEFVEVCADTLIAWMGEIAEIHSAARHDNINLNDGEAEWITTEQSQNTP